jgi:RNA polymerase sigma factor (sigma-70 family)
MGVSSRGLFGSLTRLRPPPTADSDADLLGRFVRTADEAAFAGLVRRHGPMVMAVCRRRLGREDDAEDAFQAVFLALATSAASIARPDALPGWLYRVAYQIALKAAGRRARLPATGPTTEVPMPDPLPPAWESDELKAVIDAEVAGLPDKFRAVVVLCLIEGRTSAEAAAVLGVPVGTVDSRLNTARKTLRDRLTRRGVAVGAGVALEPLLGGPVGAAGPKLVELIRNTVPAVLAEAAGPGTGAVSPAVIELARGVSAMTTNLRLLVVLTVALGLMGGAGAGLYLATAAEPVKGAAKAPEPKPAPPAPPADKPVGAEEKANAAAPTALLLKPIGKGLDPGGAPLEEIFARIEEQTELIVRVDVAAFRRVGALGEGPDGEAAPDQLLRTIYETKAVFPRQVEKLPMRDVLTDGLAQIRAPLQCTYQIRGSQLVIVPAYTPPFRPGVDPLSPGEETGLFTIRMIQEQIYGGVVSVAADKKPLADILADLRKQTGANIVLDPRCEAQEKKAALSVNLSDVRLYDALRVLTDMAELKLVYTGNIYYVTTVANAKTFQPPVPAPPVGK